MPFIGHFSQSRIELWKCYDEDQVQWVLINLPKMPIDYDEFPQFLKTFDWSHSLIILIALQLCTPRVSPSSPEEHYRAVCRALTTESIELRVFLSKVFTNDTEALRIKADAQSSHQELAKLDFRDWVSHIFSHYAINYIFLCRAEVLTINSFYIQMRLFTCSATRNA